MVTDWNITRGMPWGMEDQTLGERIRRIVASGHDQLGGETENEVLAAPGARGRVSESAPGRVGTAHADGHVQDGPVREPLCGCRRRR